jgi:hypothetical protein
VIASVSTGSSPHCSPTRTSAGSSPPTAESSSPYHSHGNDRRRCRPDRWDVAGVLVCLAGVAVIMYAPKDQLTVSHRLFRNARPTSAVLLGHSQLIGQKPALPRCSPPSTHSRSRRIGVAVVAKFFRALGDPTWLRLLRFLHEQDAVTEAVAHISGCLWGESPLSCLTGRLRLPASASNRPGLTLHASRRSHHGVGGRRGLRPSAAVPGSSAPCLRRASSVPLGCGCGRCQGAEPAVSLLAGIYRFADIPARRL